MSEQLEANNRTVREFYDLAFNQKQPAEAVRRHVGSYYRQHNPLAPDGSEAFIQFVGGFVQAFPDLRVDFKRLLAEGDLVAVHCHITRQAGDRGMAVMDIFRLENGKVVEHWDAIQDVPEQAANPNTMF
jgi:predicted SnoaL-like aldol condensation-catalyzing enzyme